MTTLNKTLEIKTLQNSIVSFKSQINFKQNEIDYLKQEQQALEVDPDDYTDQFDEMLDGSGDIDVAGYKFSVSYILKNLDPTAYRCSLNDYVDSAYSIEDVEEYKEIEEKIEEIEDQISDLEDQITEANFAISSLERQRKQENNRQGY